jgi:uncharacterized membrane protein
MAGPPDSPPHSPPDRSDLRRERIPQWLLGGVCLLWGATYGWLSWLRYATYHSRTFDLAFYVRIVWGLGRGDLWVPLSGASYLGLHLEPALSVLGLVGRVVPIAPLLLLCQAAAVACAPLPLYRLARRHLSSPWLAVVVALTALLYPTISVSTLFDFHPGTMAVTPLLFALDAFDRGPSHRTALCAWLLVALSLREDVALSIVVIGAILAIRPEGAPGEGPADAHADSRSRDRRTGLYLAALGFVWFFGYTLLVQPRFLPVHGSYDAHFGGLGHSVGEILRNALVHPAALVRLLVSEDRPLYPLVLLWPVLFLPLLAPRFVLPAVPLAAINLLSTFPRVRTLEAHYTTVLVPFLLAGAVVGAGRAADWLRARGGSALALTPGLALVLACAVAHRLHGDSPLSRSWDANRFRVDDYARAATAIVATVPPGAAVRAPRRMVAHLAERSSVTSLEDSPETPSDVLIVEDNGLPVLASPTAAR